MNTSTSVVSKWSPESTVELKVTKIVIFRKKHLQSIQWQQGNFNIIPKTNEQKNVHVEEKNIYSIQLNKLT